MSWQRESRWIKSCGHETAGTGFDFEPESSKVHFIDNCNKVGICGGFTTFSSFALETDQLIGNGHTATALCYVAASLICGFCAVLLGEKLIA